MVKLMRIGKSKHLRLVKPTRLQIEILKQTKKAMQIQTGLQTDLLMGKQMVKPTRLQIEILKQTKKEMQIQTGLQTDLPIEKQMVKPKGKLRMTSSLPA